MRQILLRMSGARLLILFGILLCLTNVCGRHIAAKAESCEAMECKAGRECRLRSNGKPECVCQDICPTHSHPICGSNDKSYINHCHLHREACLTRKHLAVKHRGYCTKDAENKEILQVRTTDTRTVACLKKERDQLRSQIISWLQHQLKLPEISRWTSSYTDLVWAEFYTCDINKDNHLDATEFLDCVKNNVTFTEYVGAGEPNELLRALCVDAIINIADADDDWKLNSTEFQNCADPSYKAQDKRSSHEKIIFELSFKEARKLYFVRIQKECFLEDKNYVDGDEISTNCSNCICACGSWVCTNTYCKPDKSTKRR